MASHSFIRNISSSTGHPVNLAPEGTADEKQDGGEIKVTAKVKFMLRDYYSFLTHSHSKATASKSNSNEVPTYG